MTNALRDNNHVPVGLGFTGTQVEVMNNSSFPTTVTVNNETYVLSPAGSRIWQYGSSFTITFNNQLFDVTQTFSDGLVWFFTIFDSISVPGSTEMSGEVTGSSTGVTMPFLIDPVTGRLEIEIYPISDLTVTGSITPDATGNYIDDGSFNGFPSFKREDSTYYIISQTGVYTIISSPKALGTPLWSKLDNLVAGDYGPVTGTGTATVTSNAVGSLNLDRSLHDDNHSTTITGVADDGSGNLLAVAVDSVTGYPIVDLVIG